MTINQQRSTVVGVFPTRVQAESAINELRRFGFTDQQIGYLERNTNGPDQENIEVQNAAVGGAVSGGVLGGLIGAASSLLIPGFGPAIAGGILAATLGGVAIGAVAGGLIGALTQMGMPEEEAQYYQNEFEAGRIIVTVYAPDRQEEVLAVLRRNGAYDASTRNEAQPYAQVGAAASPTSTYNQPGVYNQPPGMYDPDVPRPAAANAPYNPNDPSNRVTRRPYNDDVPTDPGTLNNPNNRAARSPYNPDMPTDPGNPNDPNNPNNRIARRPYNNDVADNLNAPNPY